MTGARAPASHAALLLSSLAVRLARHQVACMTILGLLAPNPDDDDWERREMRGGRAPCSTISLSFSSRKARLARVQQTSVRTSMEGDPSKEIRLGRAPAATILVLL